MSVFALPALVALLTKIWVYAFARKNEHTSETFLWLLSFFALHNLSELIVVSQLLVHDSSQLIFLKTYYAALIFSLAYMCIFTMSVVNKNRHFKFNIAALGVASLFSLMIFSTDWIIAGVSSVGYTVTAIRGSYYYVFLLLVLISFAWILFSLVKRYLSTLDLHIQLRCFYALLALSPILIMSTFVIIMMQMGFQYTGALILPFASTFLLVIVVLTEKDNDFIRMSCRLPFSIQRKVEKKILNICRSHAWGDMNLAETRNEIERVLIQSALDKSDGNVSLTATRLGIERSTLYSIFNRLDMRRQK